MPTCRAPKQSAPNSIRWATIHRKSPRANPKKVPQTDAIFAHLASVNQAADASETVLRLSLDAKATVKVGPFARGGKSRRPTPAADHDFHPNATITPVGIMLPQMADLLLYG